MNRSTQHILFALVLAVAVIAGAYCVSIACAQGAEDSCAHDQSVVTHGILMMVFVIAAVMTVMPLMQTSRTNAPSRLLLAAPATRLSLAPLRI